MIREIPHSVLATEIMEIRLASEKNKAGILEQHPFTYILDFSLLCFAHLQIWLQSKVKMTSLLSNLRKF